MLPHEWGSELTRVIGLCLLDWPSIAALSEFSKQKVCVIDNILDAHSLVHLGFYGRNRDGIRQAHMVRVRVRVRVRERAWRIVPALQ